MVGPRRIAFGTVIAAGSICRKDELRPDRLIHPGETKAINIPFDCRFPKNWKKIVSNNIIYIANLISLMHWYRLVRYRFISDELPALVFSGSIEKLNMGINERIQRLKEFCENHIQEPAHSRIAFLEESLVDLKTYEGDLQLKDLFLESLEHTIRTYGKQYITAIQGMAVQNVERGTGWLQGVVNHITEKCLKAAGLDLSEKG